MKTEKIVLGGCVAGFWKNMELETLTT